MLIKATPLTKKAGLSLKPDFIARNILNIDFKYLQSLGITTCYLDLDGTVVDRDTFHVDGAVTAALAKSGMDIKIATNRSHSRSLQELQTAVHASSVIHPKGIFGKPSKRYFRQALRDHNLTQDQVVLIGDRFIQDVLGANRSGIYSLLVFKLGRSIGRVDTIVSKAEQRYAHKLASKYLKLPK